MPSVNFQTVLFTFLLVFLLNLVVNLIFVSMYTCLSQFVSYAASPNWSLLNWTAFDYFSLRQFVCCSAFFSLPVCLSGFSYPICLFLITSHSYFVSYRLSHPVCLSLLTSHSQFFSYRLSHPVCLFLITSV